MKARIAIVILFLSVTVHAQKKGWRDLFNGKDLTGWKQVNGEAEYAVENGELVGTTVPSRVNSFLVTEETFGDFVLELDFKMDSTNSGVQIRSESKADYQDGRVHGYQVDFDPTPRAWTGGIYDEARRGWIYPLVYNPRGGKAFRRGEWNALRIECVGPAIRVWINGTPTASIVDSMTPKGFIALQVHGVYRPEDVGKKIRWKNIRINTTGIKPSKDGIFVANLDAASKAAKEGKGFEVVEKPSEKKVDVYLNKQLITAYTYQDSVMKPVLYPIRTASGITVTREYPLAIKAGERADHPHHVGLFLAHQSVNGLDFWNMSTDIKPENRNKYGKVIHTRTVVAQGLHDQACLTVQTSWRSNSGEQLLEELTTFRLRSINGDVVIDRTSELRATTREVVFKDMKDAFLGLRLARELEQPSDQKDRMVLADGSLTEPMATKDGVTGRYRNSESQIGDDIWGKRAAWACIDGRKEGKGITIAILDHPQNLEYPTYWHARGYGLFAANPLGKEVFSESKTSLDLTLRKSESITFRYRIIIHEGEPLTPAYLNSSQKEWATGER